MERNNMTREEAINKVRQMSLPKETMDILEALAPELTMSEDEMMIYELQGFLSSFGSDYFGNGEWQKFDNWLEKQKERVVDSSKTSADEDERIRIGLVGFLWSIANGEMGSMPSAESCQEWIAYLEKQKENSKPADSIPSNCVSDAKCEDRWYKVKDSLPNSAREVLCKDAIGNFFIGRYYKSTQSWEVAMYDDCDKSNEDNPPVIEWCEIPSENQKEQKLISFNDGLYHPYDHEVIEGNAISLKKKEQKPEQYDIDVLEKHITKDSISELAHTVIVRNGWEIVEAEQKPAEWNKATVNGGPIPTENQSINIPLAEWSEEDEEKIESICHSINEESIAEGLKCHGKSYSINELSKLRIKMINFLKSINPKPKQEYTITNDGVWIPRKVLEALRDHYSRVADGNKKAWVEEKDKFKYPFYLGKVEVMIDLLKHFD